MCVACWAVCSGQQRSQPQRNFPTSHSDLTYPPRPAPHSLTPPFATFYNRRRPQGAFVSNELVTSKYNALSFVPVNLYHQFKRVANMYFAALVCLQVRF